MLLFALALGLLAVGVLGVGLGNLRKVDSVEDYLVAGRRSSGLATGGSLAATIIGGSSTLGLAGLAFRRGLTGSWWLLVGAVGLLGLIFFLAGAKERPVHTLPELIGIWYGEGMRKIAAFMVLAAWLGIIGAQTQAAGRILAAFLGGRPAVWSLAAGALFVLYTVSGGQLSVIRTDLLQLTLIVAGCLSCAAGGLLQVGGFHALAAALPPGHLDFPFSAAFAPKDLLLLALVVGSTYLVGPDMLSRVFCSRDVRAARRGVLLAALLLLPFSALVTLIGLEARVLFPAGGPESAFPLLARWMPLPLLGAAGMVGLLGAFLSSADTTLITAASIVSLDLLGGAAAGSLGRLRAVTALVGVLAVAVGLAAGGIIASLLLGYTLFSGSLFVPAAAALAGRPLSRRAATICALGGGALALGGKLAGRDSLIALAFALAAAAAAGDRLLAARARPR